ncbi:GGDEF domain-containing protein [Bacillus coahuilensis]|uniref:GGDEF domain-containing protein n=1 Tax=Bacillus coahuilensis TaxID=408580 RepID=UPI00018509A1|nr:GGDEF domain-containing protein [Bacillus coahuilensis]
MFKITRITTVIYLTLLLLLFMMREYLIIDNVENELVEEITLLFIVFLYGVLSYVLGFQVDKYRYLSFKDSTSGAYSKYYLAKKFAKWKKKETEFYLYMIDIDNFKQLNDHYGHIYGDRVLKSVATTLMQQTNSVVSRWGGDEFVLLNSKPILHNFPSLQHKIQEELQQILPSNRITCSIGEAKYTTDGETLEELVKKADKQMYLHKRKKENLYSKFIILK